MLNIIKASQYGKVQPANATVLRGSSADSASLASFAADDDDDFSGGSSAGGATAEEIFVGLEGAARTEAAPKNHQAVLDRERLAAQEKGYQEGFKIGNAEGFEQGRKDGCELGRETSADKARVHLEELRAALDMIEHEKEAVLEGYRESLEAITWKVTEKVLCREFKNMPESMADIIASALKQHRNEVRVRISVSSGMESVLARADVNLLEKLKRVSDDITIVAASSMRDQDCMIELPDEVMDVGLETQLNNVKKVLDVG